MNPILQIIIVAIVAFIGLSTITYLLQRQRVEKGKSHPPDPMTKLPTIDAFRAQVRRAFGEAVRTKSYLSIIVIDLDQLNRFNELYGRETGDQLIYQSAMTMKSNLRKHDPFGRTAGQQFAAIVPTDAEQARKIADRLLVALRKTSHPVGTHMLKITASAGVSTVPTHTKSAEGLFHTAIEALKAAKQGGRNRVIVFDPSVHTLPDFDQKSKTDRL